ncbi:MAG TPA: BREX system ATP-binding domain-containing protein, partial [Sphingomicrobium sp.]|nr:BREX system ATP-binding domain-containing protein [Sphingomicrobium sp.]
AMDAVIAGFRDRCHELALQSGGDAQRVQAAQLAPLESLPLGLDFARVIASYMDGLDYQDEAFLAKHRRWLRAQFDNNTESRAAGFPPAIADDHFWSMVKLWGMFIRLAGRPGLVLVLDEARLLDEVLTTPTRNANYAEIFRIYDEVAQGLVTGVGLFVAATPAMVGSKQSKGLCSEPGLRSCLQNGECIGHPSDLIEPVAFQLPELDPDSIEEILLSVRELIGKKCPDARLIPESDIPAFIEESKDRLGGQQYPPPRDLIHRFLKLHNRLASNPQLQWSDLIHGPLAVEASVSAAAAESGDYADWSM